MSTRTPPESGLFTGLVNFVREDVTGQFNTDPDYRRFSDEVVDVSFSPGYGVERRDAVGTADATGHDKGTESSEIEITYRLQRPLVDDSGAPLDAAADAWLRDADNRILNTHGVRIRDDRSTTGTRDPQAVDGARQYIIGQACYPDATLEDAPDDGTPVEVTLTYTCEKVREYEVFQPPGDEALEVSSTDADDTTQTLTLEDDQGNSEDVSLNGTTGVTTTKTDWSSIRAAELDAETNGDVRIQTASSGPVDGLITRINGADAYSNSDGPVEGDLGIPTVGGGSLGTAVGANFESVKGATITRGGAPIQFDVAQLTLSCSNGYSATARHDSFRPRINEGNRDPTAEMDLVGWGASAKYLEQMNRTATGPMSVQFQKSKFDFLKSVTIDTDDVERGPDDSAIAFGVTFEASADSGVQITNLVSGGGGGGPSPT